MTEFCFIHAADVHLDSPLLGLEQYDGAPADQIRGATRQALKNLVDLAIAEKVAFVLFAGDLYDGDWRDYNTGLFFAAQMSKLREVGIRAFIAAGNHDAASQITKYLRMPDNVKVLSVQEPESVVLEDLGVAIHGQGFPTRAVLADLSLSYPAPTPGLFNIGMLHTSVDGREGHEPYAPCTREGLISKGYQYWALGHVHKREILHTDPWVIFPGNVQGRHIKETGPKGCTLVAVQDGRVAAAKHRDLDVLRWSLCEVDASGSDTGDETLNRAVGALERELKGSDGRALAVRVVILGSCKAHRELSVNFDRWTNEIRAAAADLSGGKIWIEQVVALTKAELDLDQVLERNDTFSDLLRSVIEFKSNGRVPPVLVEELKELRRRLPEELRQIVDLENPEQFQQAVEDVQQLLIARLLRRAENS